jgi:DHA1 family tetracycline resistance protein-like MFS transporter
MAGSWALMNFFASPVLGALSDRYGRRPVILISAFGFSLDLMVMALAPTVAWLFIGRLVSGLTAASYSAAAAYLADVTPPDQRARRFGLFSGIYAAGMILGPAFGGALGEISPRAPFFAAAALAALGWLYGLIILPESLPPELRTKIAWRTANPVRAFGILGRDRGLLGLAGVAFLLQLGSTAANTVFVLYTGFRYHWTSVDVGLLLMGFGAGNILTMAIVAPRLVQRIGERTTLLAGLTISAIGFAGLGLASTGLQFCVACIPTCFGNVCGPPLQALQTRRVGPTEQGRLQGALSGVAALTGLVGPIFFTQVFAWSVAFGSRPARSGVAFLIGAGLLTSAWSVAFTLARSPAKTLTPD